MQTALLFAAAWVAFSVPIGVLTGRIIAYGQSRGATVSPASCGRPRTDQEERASSAAPARAGR